MSRPSPGSASLCAARDCTLSTVSFAGIPSARTDRGRGLTAQLERERVQRPGVARQDQRHSTERGEPPISMIRVMIWSTFDHSSLGVTAAVRRGARRHAEGPSAAPCIPTNSNLLLRESGHTRKVLFIPSAFDRSNARHEIRTFPSSSSSEAPANPSNQHLLRY